MNTHAAPSALPGSRRARRVGALPACLALLLVGCAEPEPAGPARLPDVVLEIAAADHPTLVQPVPLRTPLAPDHQTEAFVAWNLETLFGGAFEGQEPTLEVQAAGGPDLVVITRPFRPDEGRVWVLRANRKGDAILELVDPSDPFPARHGRGGSRGRPGSGVDRIAGVVRLRLVLGGGSGPATEGAHAPKEQMMLQLEVEVDGATRKLTEDDLAELEPLSVQGDSEKGMRDAFSLRVLARSVAGEGARVTELRGEGGRLAHIASAAWEDGTRTPVLRLNRRGNFKFHWTDAQGAPAGGEQLRNVERLVIARTP